MMLQVKESQHNSQDYGNFLVLSLGTGSLEKRAGHEIGLGGLLDWVFSVEKGLSPLFDVMFRANDDMVDIYTSFILRGYGNNYLRIQYNAMKPREAKMDNASRTNLARLAKIGRDLLDRPVSMPHPHTGLFPDDTTQRGTETSNRVALIR